MSKLNKSAERSRKRRKLSPPSEFEKTVTSEGERYENSKTEDGASTVLPSVKDLASSEASTRRAALKNIIIHLQQRPSNSNLSSTECLQLWKGFFVAIYMHDSKNAISVQNLLREIASTFQSFHNKDRELHKGKLNSESNKHASSSWLEQYHVAFWQTLVKEWAGIDSHRMNKYLLLVRFVMRELATICLRPLFEKSLSSKVDSTNGKNRKRKSNAEAEDKQNDVIGRSDHIKTESITKVLQIDGPLNTKDRKIPDGLRLHLLDLYVTEVFSALSTLEDAADEAQKPKLAAIQEVLVELKSPVLTMSQSDSGAPKNVRTKAKEALEDFTLKEDEIQDS